MRYWVFAAVTTFVVGISSSDAQDQGPPIGSGTQDAPQLSDGSWLKALEPGRNSNNSVMRFDVSPDGRELAVPCGDGLVRFFAIADGKLTSTLQAHSKYVWQVVYSPDGSHLATINAVVTARALRDLRLWERETGKRLCSKTTPNHGTDAIHFSDDGERITYVTRLRTVSFEAASGKLVHSAKPDLPLGQMYPLPDGRHFYFPNSHNDLSRLVKVEGDKVIDVFKFTSEGQTATPPSALSRDGNWFAICRHDLPTGVAPADDEWKGKTPINLSMFDLKTNKHSWTQRVPPLHLISTMTISPDGRYLATAGHRPLVPDYLVKADENVSPDVHGYSLSGRIWPNGAIEWQIVTPYRRSYANAIRVWDVATGEILGEVPLADFDVNHLVFTRDSKNLIIGGSIDPGDDISRKSSKRDRSRLNWYGGIVGCLLIDDVLNWPRKK